MMDLFGQGLHVFMAFFDAGDAVQLRGHGLQSETSQSLPLNCEIKPADPGFQVFQFGF